VRVRILGSGAGGGVPQWNCNCRNCDDARSGSVTVESRTQTSVAVSADGDSWFLIGVSPDVRQQVNEFAALAPPSGRRRGTRISGFVLTDAEIDTTLGLLALREGERIPLHATRDVHELLQRDFPIVPILARWAERPFVELPLDAQVDLIESRGDRSGLRVRAFSLVARVPRYARDPAPRAGARIGLIVEDERTGGRLVHAIGVAGRSPELELAVEDADVVLIDGTFWSEDELALSGGPAVGASAMGHWPVGGSSGSLAWLGTLPVRRRVFVHVNNTNPMLRADSAERALVERNGVHIARDGDEWEVGR
jgi:pyrroloquinoline quinone biosynthesis protein B